MKVVYFTVLLFLAMLPIHFGLHKLDQLSYSRWRERLDQDRLGLQPFDILHHVYILAGSAAIMLPAFLYVIVFDDNGFSAGLFTNLLLSAGTLFFWDRLRKADRDIRRDVHSPSQPCPHRWDSE